MDRYTVFLKHPGGVLHVAVIADKETEESVYFKLWAGEKMVGQFVKAEVLGFKVEHD